MHAHESPLVSAFAAKQSLFCARARTLPSLFSCFRLLRSSVSSRPFRVGRLEGATERSASRRQWSRLWPMLVFGRRGTWEAARVFLSFVFRARVTTMSLVHSAPRFGMEGASFANYATRAELWRQVANSDPATRPPDPILHMDANARCDHGP